MSWVLVMVKAETKSAVKLWFHDHLKRPWQSYQEGKLQGKRFQLTR